MISHATTGNIPNGSEQGAGAPRVCRESTSETRAETRAAQARSRVYRESLNQTRGETRVNVSLQPSGGEVSTRVSRVSNPVRAYDQGRRFINVRAGVKSLTCVRDHACGPFETRETRDTRGKGTGRGRTATTWRQHASK